jgi:hypothetical protein
MRAISPGEIERVIGGMDGMTGTVKRQKNFFYFHGGPPVAGIEQPWRRFSYYQPLGKIIRIPPTEANRRHENMEQTMDCLWRSMVCFGRSWFVLVCVLTGVANQLLFRNRYEITRPSSLISLRLLIPFRVFLWPCSFLTTAWLEKNMLHPHSSEVSNLPTYFSAFPLPLSWLYPYTKNSRWLISFSFSFSYSDGCCAGCRLHCLNRDCSPQLLVIDTDFALRS